MLSLAALVALGTLQTAPFENDFDNVLSTASLTTLSARFDTSILGLFVSSDDETPLFKSFHRDPWRMPFLAESLRYDFANHFDRPNETLRIGMRTLGYQTRRSLVTNPNAKPEADAKGLGALERVLNEYKQAGVIKGEVPSVAAIPREIQEATALVLSTATNAVKFRRLAVRQLGNIEDSFNFVASSASRDLDGENLDRLLRIPKSYDMAYMSAAAHDLSLAISTAAALLQKIPPTLKYKFEVETTWGMIRLTGGEDNTHADKACFLTIDTGGNDVYINHPRTSSASNWASITIDTAGDDQYLSDPNLAKLDIPTFADRKNGSALPGPGGAIFGFACIYDTNGNDLYRSHLPSMGSGRFGVGMLIDLEGNDTYDSYRESQGFGHQGGGFLMDLAGDDQYQCFQFAQGCGLNGGVGYLLDHSGNDTYLANDQTIDFPSAQDAKHNMSMVQGAGMGRRADISDGHSLPGGVGILYDVAGQDSYKSGVFGQGVGYWQGVGILFEGGGTDTYEGQWYVQGASAHFAVGYLQDDSGDDRYTAHLNMAQGAGHDFSTGMLIDKAGNDQYRAPNLSLGAGNANGIGIFIEVQGNDTYESSGLTIGKAAPAPKFEIRSRALTLGVFMDLFGTDRYPESAVHAGDARRQASWTEKLLRPFESQVGIFFDR